MARSATRPRSSWQTPQSRHAGPDAADRGVLGSGGPRSGACPFVPWSLPSSFVPTGLVSPLLIETSCPAHHVTPDRSSHPPPVFAVVVDSPRFVLRELDSAPVSFLPLHARDVLRPSLLVDGLRDPLLVGGFDKLSLCLRCGLTLAACKPRQLASVHLKGFQSPR